MSPKSKIILLSVMIIALYSLTIYNIITGSYTTKDIIIQLAVNTMLSASLIIKFKKSLKKAETPKKASLQEDIVKANDWIVRALKSSNYKADYSMESLKDIDRFFDEENHKDGILSQNVGNILFGIGVYVGETIIKNVGGAWDSEDCQDETILSLKLDEHTVIYPIQRVMSRYKKGNEYSIYDFVMIMKSNME